MDIFNNLIKFFKIETKYIVTIFCLTTFLLFAPELWINKIGIKTFINNYKSIIGIFFLTSIFLTVTRFLGYFYRIFIEKRKIEKFKISLEILIKELNQDEKFILKHFIEQKVCSLYLNSLDGCVSSLESKSIIYRTSNITFYSGGMGNSLSFPYSLDSDIENTLKKNPNLLI